MCSRNKSLKDLFAMSCMLFLWILESLSKGISTYLKDLFLLNLGFTALHKNDLANQVGVAKAEDLRG